MRLTAALPDPDVSIVIRSRNNLAYVKKWFEDIRAQEFNGAVEVIVVDTESTDGTVAYARAQGATVIQLKQQEFTYPLSLNVGFQAAKYPYVATLVGHANLTNRMTLKSLTYWCQHENFAGLYCLPVANKNGSLWERLGSMVWPFVLRRPYVLRKSSGGMLAGTGAIIKREVWQKLGGYDERYAGGGEDMAFGRSVLAADLMIVREPLLTVFHSHGLGFGNTVRQIWHWLDVGRAKPQTFVTSRVHARRPDLRSE